MQNKNIFVTIVLQLAYSMSKIAVRNLPRDRKVIFSFLMYTLKSNLAVSVNSF